MLIGRTEILRGKLYLVGHAPTTGTIRPKTTVLYDKSYPAEVFNHEEYFQVQLLPHDATPECHAPYREMIEAVKNQNQGRGFRTYHPAVPLLPLQRPTQAALGNPTQEPGAVHVYPFFAQDN